MSKTDLIMCAMPILVIAALVLYLKMSKDIFNDKDIFPIFKFIFAIIAIFAILFFTSSIIWILNFIYKNIPGIEHTEQLTTATITAFALIVTITGYYYTKRQDRIRDIHTESQWRSRLLDLEKKPQYYMDDLLELNSFINPFHKKNNDLDFLVSYAIKTIQQNHLSDNKEDKNEFLNFYKLVSDSKISNDLKIILQREKPNSRTIFDFNSDYKNSNITINLNNNIKISITSDEIPKEKLFAEEITVIRKCIHALLKNDWMNAHA